MAQGQKKITVKFQPVGHKALERAIKNLAKVQKDLENNVKNLNKTYRLSAKDVDAYRHRVEANTKAANKNSTAITRLQSFIAQYRNKLLLAAFAVTAYSKTIGMLTKLYSNQEMAEKKLAAQLGYTSQALLDFASAQQEITTFGDEVTIGAMSQVAAFTKNETAIKGVITASQNLSAGLGIDFNSAVTQVTKTIFSNTNALSRQGIEFDNSLRGSERFKAALESIQSKFAGQAQTEAGTYAGKIDQLGDSLGDLGENIGEVLAEALLPFVKGLRDLTEVMKVFPADMIVKGITAIGLAALTTRKRLIGMTEALGVSGIFGVAGGKDKKSGGGFFGFIPSFKNMGKGLGGLFKRIGKGGLKIAAITLAIEGMSRAIGGLFNLFSSDDSIQEKTDQLTGLDKALFDNQNSLKGLRKIQQEIQADYDKETKALQKIIEKRKKASETKYGTPEMQATGDPFTSFFMSGSSPQFESQFSYLEDAVSQDVLDAQQDLADHLNKTSESGLELIKVENALNDAINKNTQAVQGYVATLEDEIKQLSLKANHKGADLKLQELINKAEKEGIELQADQINMLSALIQKTEDFKQASIDAKQSQSIFQKSVFVADESEKKSPYAILLQDIKDLQPKLQEIVNAYNANPDSFTLDQLQIMQNYVKAMRNYNQEREFLEGQGLGVMTVGELETVALIHELTEAKLTEKEVTEKQIENIETLKTKMQEGTGEYEKADAAVKQLKDDLEKMGTVYAGVEKFVVTHIDAITNSLVQASIAGEHMGRAVNQALIQIAHTLATKAAVFGILSGLFGFNLGTFSSFLGFRQGGHVQGYNMGGYVNPQSFSGGGYVDTVPAMLTEGEFVMSRRAVDSIGVENLNRMNREGTAGQNININISGNVMSRNFTESEIIPAIKDAVRRGADLGVS